MHPWIRKLLGERTQICYAYGEQGEFYYLQYTLGANRGDNPRFRELIAKSFDQKTKTNIPLAGGYWSCTIRSSRQHVIRKTGVPLAKRMLPIDSANYDEEWDYLRFVLLFKRGRFVDVRPKGTEQPEFVWRETYIPK